MCLVDDMMDDEDEEAETDAIVNQVLDEIGISLTQEVRAYVNVVPFHN